MTTEDKARSKLDLTEYFGEGNESFTMKIGGTTYQVNSFWDEEGTESVLQQFMDILSSEIENS